MENSPVSTVCLDGRAVRQIREKQKLTQLYVAKVVGVTTDTISRWENNRYPSVKRENVLRLAEALECRFEDLLKSADHAEDQDREPINPERSIKPFLFFGLVLLLIFAAAGYFLLVRQRTSVPHVTAYRWSPGAAAPGSVIPVYVSLEGTGRHHGFILREHFPPGWKLIEANPPASSLDNVQGTARWIVKAGEGRSRIVYLLKVDSKAPFDQEVIFNGDIVGKGEGPTPVSVSGASKLKVAPLHWADLNGDAVIQDEEILQASDIADEMQGVHLDWKLLESLWRAGQYRYDEKKRQFEPVLPKHALILRN